MLSTSSDTKLVYKFRPEKTGFNMYAARGFNGSVNFSENCDFRSQFDPFYVI